MTAIDRDGSVSTVAVVLAAGLGKRFGTEHPKVMAQFHGRPLVHWVTDSLRAAGIQRAIIVIGHRGEEVEQSYARGSVEFVWQRERLGTGHAVRQAESSLTAFEGTILVLLGDAPCVRPHTILDLLTHHTEIRAAATILSAEVADPTGYGRIVRAGDGTVDRIVEHRDANDSIRAIREINSGMICFRADLLWEYLERVGNQNDQHEYYLTDVIGLLRASGETVAAFVAPDPREVLGVNSPEELHRLELLCPR